MDDDVEQLTLFASNNFWSNQSIIIPSQSLPYDSVS